MTTSFHNTPHASEHSSLLLICIVSFGLQEGAWSIGHEPVAPVSRGELNDNQKAELKDLLQNYKSLTSSPGFRLRPRGLINGGNICFMNSILQVSAQAFLLCFAHNKARCSSKVFATWILVRASSRCQLAHFWCVSNDRLMDRCTLVQALTASGPFCAFLKRLGTIRPALTPQKEPALYCLAALGNEFELVPNENSSNEKPNEAIPLHAFLLSCLESHGYQNKDCIDQDLIFLSLFNSTTCSLSQGVLSFVPLLLFPLSPLPLSPFLIILSLPCLFKAKLTLQPFLSRSVSLVDKLCVMQVVSLGGKPLSPEMMSLLVGRFNPRSVPTLSQGTRNTFARHLRPLS